MNGPGADASTSPAYKLGSAVLAFAVWGGWAFYVNRPSGLGTGLISGMAQGTASALMTLVMIKVVTEVFRRLRSRVARMIAPTVATVGGAAVLLVVVHTLVGTPEIAWTILPGLSAAVPFCAFTTHKLSRATV